MMDLVFQIEGSHSLFVPTLRWPISLGERCCPDDSYHPSINDFLPHAQFGKGKSGNMNPCTESSENPQ